MWSFHVIKLLSDTLSDSLGELCSVTIALPVLCTAIFNICSLLIFSGIASLIMCIIHSISCHDFPCDDYVRYFVSSLDRIPFFYH